MLYTILSIIIFFFLILIHEFGHFIVAKWSGIKVNEFAIGMGPKLWSKQKGETIYSLRAIPIGGFCAMEGEENGDKTDPRAFPNAKPWKRLLVILAGVTMNAIFAIIIFYISILKNGVVTNQIDAFTDNSPALEQNVQVGDKIIKINDAKIKRVDDLRFELQAFYTNNDKNTPVNVIFENDEGQYKKTIQPVFEDDRPLLGVIVKKQDLNFIQSIPEAFNEFGQNIKQIFRTIEMLFNKQLSTDNLSGPIGIVSAVNEQSDELDIFSLFYFMAYISVNLSVINLLPFPIVDGGKAIETLYEMITGKPVNRKFLTVITVIGATILISLFLFTTYNDILRLIKK